MERPIRILVVDDNEAAAKVFALVLSLDGYEVRESYSGKQAIEVAKSFLPDVAFLDLGIPFMDGFEIASQIRQIPGLEKTILFAITGRSGKEHVDRSLEAGFSRHLVKPVEPDAVKKLLDEFQLSTPRNRNGAVAVKS